MSVDPAREVSARDALVPMALLATALGLRASLLADDSVSLLAADLRGFLADIVVSLAFWSALLVVGHGSRAIAAIGGAAWVVLHFANAEQVRVLGSQAATGDIGFLLDPTFLLGSAVAITHPVWFAAAVVGVPLLIWWTFSPASLRTGRPVRLRTGRPVSLRTGLPVRFRSAFGRAAVVAGAALALGVGVRLWPMSPDVAAWRQSHFVAQNAARLARQSPVADPGRDVALSPRAAMLGLDPALAADLGGIPLLPLPGPGHNVLLLMLESVSGVHVQSTAAAQGREPVAPMPFLSALARDNLMFSRFFSLQRKTNRGAYAVLCGDLPNLAGGLPKMSAYATDAERPCLPALMRDAGYATAFVQAAPLGFMLKGQFMPRAGFERVRGREWFDTAYARNVWGVDDRAFFERSVAMVATLEETGEPWFLTLLNVGTHHPYVLPEDFLPEEPSRFVRALAYLDLALGEFFERLEDMGVLDDTIVVVTSDESMGIPGLFVDPWTQAISQNWGFLVVRLPEPRALRIDTPNSQLDLAVSVLDAVGLGDAGAGLFGRSVFRRYEDPRRLYFANSNLFSAGMLDAEERLLICRDEMQTCRRFSARDGRTFGVENDSLPPSPADEARLAAMVRASVRSIAEDTMLREFELVGERRVHLDEIGANEVIHGGQYVDLRAGDWLEVELEVEVSGEGEGARGRLTHLLKQQEPPAPYVGKFPLRAGQTLRLRYSYAPAEPVSDIQCSSSGELLAGEGLDFEFRTALMRVRRDGVAPGPGLQVESLEIEGDP